MSFSFRPAVRENVGLLIGIAGPTGSGKTFSAMRLASGIVGEGKRFAVIDTEARRALHYADRFAFDHGDLGPPFRPEAYAEAIQAADKAGYAAILIDSASHEWAGEGGILDWQEQELARMAGQDAAKRERVKMASWIKPKMAHKRMVSVMLQTRAFLIFCLRAEEKMKMVKRNGRTEPVEAGFQPICEKGFMFEMTASFMLSHERPGIPEPIKLEEQHRKIVPLDEPLSEETGKALAAWAAGGAPRVVAKPESAAVEKLKTIAAKAQGEEWQGFLIEQDMKQGTSKRGPWKLYLLRTADNLQFGTFSEGTANELAPYVGSDIAVKIIWSKTPKGGRQIESYEILEP